MINIKGQSLVELIVAIAVIEVGLFSVWSLFLVNFNAEREAEYRIVGVNLAREGVEVVKNIRDSNWLKRNYNIPVNSQSNTGIWSWDQNLEVGTSTVNFDSAVLEDEKYADIYLNAAGFFTNVVTDKKTPYQRRINIKDICCIDNDNNFKCDDTNFTVVDNEACDLKIGINVVSQATWDITGKKRQAVVEDNLYDWQ